MQEMMKNMGGGAGGAELPDSDDEDEEEEAPGEPMRAKGDGLGDLEGEVVKNPAAAEAATKKEMDDELD